ncbi:hypothetical protein TNIN_341871 [Trichonephila inaurata madagascariensis]|uniref:Uncharacterized protein n=1 Tax=Trichonephila inaurata madagascariensis TaxID=2747483 RepID=A0A8X6Y0G0_9ARAC|nr:hypothetical protein TNIN_341871 [Trichonephila inaurata madagascariensis]
MNNTPAPPKVNFWEQRAKNVASCQQPNPSTSKKPSQATPSTSHTSTEPASDIFEQLNSPAVRDLRSPRRIYQNSPYHSPTKYGCLWAIKQLLGDKINF